MKHIFRGTDRIAFVAPAWRITARLDGIVGIEFETSDIVIWYGVADEDKDTWDSFDLGVWQLVFLPTYIFKATPDHQKYIFKDNHCGYSYAMAHQSIKDTLRHVRHMPDAEWATNWLERIDSQVLDEWDRYRRSVVSRFA